MKKAMRRYGTPNEIVTDKLGSYGAAARELGCSKKQVTSDGQTTELRIHTYPLDDEKGPCFDLDECTAYRNSPQSMPRFTILFNSQRSLSKRSTFKLNRDAAITEWRSLVIS